MPRFPFFSRRFDVLCAQNGHLVVLTILKGGCKQIKDIWEECFKYFTEELFPYYEEGNTDSIDHVWAMGIILSYLLCSYPALKGTEDIKCYNNVGVGPKAQPGEQERLERDGDTFPAKKWCNLMPEAREHIKQCKGNIQRHARKCMKEQWNSLMKKVAKQSKIKKQKLKELTNKEKKEGKDGNKRNIQQ
eukprot:jgi/Psemu1/15974/gm1.15974_g